MRRLPIRPQRSANSARNFPGVRNRKDLFRVYKGKQSSNFPARLGDAVMKPFHPIAVLRIPLALGVAIAAFNPPAAAAQSFAIKATNVVISSSGTSSSQFTITGIPMTGTITLSCEYSGSLTNVKLPSCPLTPPVGYSVNSGGTLTGSIAFYPYGSAIPASLPLGRPRRSDRTAMAFLALAGASLLSLGFRRRTSWLVLVLFAVCGLAALGGISGCGGGNSFAGMTPGTYPYTVKADNEASGPTPLGQSVSTTIYVTVP